MDSVLLVTQALELIEANLTSEIRTEDIASRLYCSKSTLEKLFKYVTNMGVHDYFVRRRMSRAAKDIVAEPNVSLLDIGIRYGYGSNEAFTRAFKSIWHTTPSEYRNNPVRFELFPAFNLDPELMEDAAMDTKKKVDISELYDYINERKNCYFIGLDIKGLVPINDISHKAGDIAILTALQRLESAVGDDDIVFRIGGDEFVAVTCSEDVKYAKDIVEEILSHNGEEFECDGRQIPLSVYTVIYKLEDKVLRYSELFTALQNEIDLVKENEYK